MTLRIGVLGGIGPEATGLFYLKLVRKMQETGMITRNDDFPQIIINSIPAPELTSGCITTEDLKTYIEGVDELDSIGVDFIVMVCNTIHLYFDMLQASVKTTIIDLRKEVHKRLTKDKLRCVSILGTPCTISKGLYEFKGLDYINPSDGEVHILSRAIVQFNNGIDREKQIRIAKQIAEGLLSRGSETIVLACTEFAVMLESEDIPCVNTIDVLVNAVLERFMHALNPT